ncbi:MAG TPA: hypothetical protein VHU17_18140 [Acidimicrobiales bacterium]|jgi:hypothetical protein|nr:hypothetical protein [Acidimicrobiales bacterium]
MTQVEENAGIEAQKLRVAANADRFAETEDRLAETMTEMANLGAPENRERRLQLADHARTMSEQERVEAEKWRSIHAAENQGSEPVGGSISSEAG